MVRPRPTAFSLLLILGGSAPGCRRTNRAPHATDPIGNIRTACGRLRSTPTPFTDTLLLHRTAWLF